MPASSTYAPPRLLAHFPQHVLLNVFSWLPLRDLVHIDEVCSAFGELKLVALARRRHLYIVHSQEDLARLEAPEFRAAELLQHVKEDKGDNGEGKGDVPLVKRKVRLDRHALITGVGRPLTAAQLDKIVDLMPNVAVLRLVRAETYLELWKIKCLLNCYRPQLLELTLWFLNPEGASVLRNDVDEDIDLVCSRFEELTTSVLHSVNSLPALRSLDLNLETPSAPLPIEVRLPIIAAGRRTTLRTLRLRTFGFSDGTVVDSETVLRRSLFQVPALNDARGAISLKELYIGEMPMRLELALSIGPCLAHVLRELDITSTTLVGEEFGRLRQLATQCPGLQDLKVSVICPGVESLGRLVEALTPCKALLHLTILSNATADTRYRRQAALLEAAAAANRAEAEAEEAVEVPPGPPEPVNQEQEPQPQPPQPPPVLPSLKALR